MRRADNHTATIAWALVAFLVNFLILDEILGINHVLGLQPITVDSESNPLLFGAIAAAGPDFLAWWVVHIYRRKYGDLSGKN